MQLRQPLTTLQVDTMTAIYNDAMVESRQSYSAAEPIARSAISDYVHRYYDLDVESVWEFQSGDTDPMPDFENHIMLQCNIPLGMFAESRHTLATDRPGYRRSIASSVERYNARRVAIAAKSVREAVRELHRVQKYYVKAVKDFT